MSLPASGFEVHREKGLPILRRLRLVTDNTRNTAPEIDSVGQAYYELYRELGSKALFPQDITSGRIELPRTADDFVPTAYLYGKESGQPEPVQYSTLIDVPLNSL